MLYDDMSCISSIISRHLLVVKENSGGVGCHSLQQSMLSKSEILEVPGVLSNGFRRILQYKLCRVSCCHDHASIIEITCFIDLNQFSMLESSFVRYVHLFF